VTDSSNMDTRMPFDDVLLAFGDFLKSQGWSKDVLWLSRDRITGHRTDYWVYRPDELKSAVSTRQWYEDSRKKNWNLQVEGIGQYNGSTLAFVARGPGQSRRLDFSALTSEHRVHIVSSQLRWFVWRLVCKVRGESPALLHADMPRKAESISAAIVD
jgi:hypothetical protein